MKETNEIDKERTRKGKKEAKVPENKAAIYYSTRPPRRVTSEKPNEEKLETQEYLILCGALIPIVQSLDGENGTENETIL